MQTYDLDRSNKFYMQTPSLKKFKQTSLLQEFSLFNMLVGIVKV